MGGWKGSTRGPMLVGEMSGLPSSGVEVILRDDLLRARFVHRLANRVLRDHSFECASAAHDIAIALLLSATIVVVPS